MKVGVASLEYRRDRGVERISSEIADWIAEHGHNVDYHCTRWSDIHSRNVRFHRVPTIGVSNSLRLMTYALAARASMAGKGYDVTHSYGNVVGCDVITAQSCHRAGMNAAKQYLAYSVGRRRNFGIADRVRLTLERENFAKRKYRKIIAASTSVKRELVAHYHVPPDDIAVIPNGVNVEEFTPDRGHEHRERIRHVLGISQTVPVVIFVGHEFARKGLDAVMRALTLLSQERVHLLVCGSDDSSRFEKMAERLRVSDRIRYVGGQNSMKEFYAAADALVFPTMYEPFGLVITEAMASGLPVVVSRTAGAAEDIIEDGKDGLLLSDPRSETEIADRVRTLVNYPTLRQSIGKMARQKVQAYTWEACAGKVLGVYEEVAAGHTNNENCF